MICFLAPNIEAGRTDLHRDYGGRVEFHGDARGMIYSECRSTAEQFIIVTPLSADRDLRARSFSQVISLAGFCDSRLRAMAEDRLQ